MADPFRKYKHFTYRELYWKLKRDGMPNDLIEKTVEALRQHRRALTTAKQRERERTKQWGEVISSLQHERRIVRSMVRYKTATPSPERDDFVREYDALLTKLYERLQAKRHLNNALPEHSHWTDYVPEHIKEAFRIAADSIPPRQKAKVKEPFRKADPTKLRDLRQGRLLRYIEKSLETVIAKLEVSPDDEATARREFVLREAKKRVRAMPIDAHIPNHWRDVVPEMLVGYEDTN